MPPGAETVRTIPETPSPSADDLASTLGLTVGSLQVNEEPLPAAQSSRLREQLDRLRLDGAAAEDQILSHFCATYLPKLADAFLDPHIFDDLAGDWYKRKCGDAFTTMLHALRENRYFAKFLLSNHPSARKAKEMPRYQARRVLQFAAVWNMKLDTAISFQLRRELTAIEAVMELECQLLLVL